MAPVAAMRFAPCTLLLIVAACSGGERNKTPDNESDPAVTEALAEPVMSDMQMSGAASPDALRPGEQPATLPVPLDARIDTMGAPTLGDIVANAVREPAFAGCAAEIGYSAMWSLKLPAPLALPKDARLAEAAGSDRAGCGLRVVRFALPGAPAASRTGYESFAKREGFVVSTSGSMITGLRTKDGLAFRMDVTLSKDGSRVDLVTRSR
jgi:hypothetical protein